MNTIGIIINDVIVACAGAAIATAIIGITIFRTRLKRASARENMTNGQKWKHDLKCWIDGLGNKDLEETIKELDVPNIPSICAQCEHENGECRAEVYPCPFTLDKGIDDYMNARISDWSFRGYVGVYLSKQRAIDYCKALGEFKKGADASTVAMSDILETLK